MASTETRSPDSHEEEEREVEEVSDEDALSFHSARPTPSNSNVPERFQTFPPIADGLQTETSLAQDENVEDCMPLLTCTDAEQDHFNAAGVPHLRRAEHVAFLRSAVGSRPRYLTLYDAARPWMLYWAFTGLCLLGEDVTCYRDRAIYTLAAAQHPDGGYSGGHGQLSHTATSYAAVFTLAMVGGEEALESIDRKAMWKFLGRMKQAEGGFSLCEGGEVDIRGAYCAMVVIALLNLPLELPADAPVRQGGLTTFTDKLPEWLSQCQTYEGGVSGLPGAEAHGAYAFCGLACMCILGEPQTMLPRYLDVPALAAWLSARQYQPEGGFSGRTNKLVDACYSHWVGGCWPLLAAALQQQQRDANAAGPAQEAAVPSIFDREGLARYILCCCQPRNGGLRDKPSRPPDGYHSCYALAGLSSVQHDSAFRPAAPAPLAPRPLDAAFGWHHVDGGPSVLDEILEEQDLVEPVHPIFVIPFEVVARTEAYFRQKTSL